MKKLTVLKSVFSVVLFMSYPTAVYTASESVIENGENHSDSTEEEALGENGDVKKTPSKPIRSEFSFAKLPEGNEQPWKLIRGLQLRQDDIVQGKARAQDAYKLLHTHLSTVFSKQDDNVWKHERNLDAIAVYILLGGSTEFGYKALQKTNLSNLQKQPLVAALAFAERDLGKAYELLLELDHLALPPSMSSQFALAKSMVVSSINLDMALKYLREARRLAPGTLIEESAIRRSIRIAGEKKASEDFFRLSKTYLRRFKKSYYFNDFLRNFGYALVRMPRYKEVEVLKFLQEVLSQVSITQKVAVAAYVARYATISGRRKLSLWASKMALEKLKEGSVTYDRMQLYLASAEIVNQENVGIALATLQTIDSDKFDQIDQKIFKTTEVLAKQILQDSMGIIKKQSKQMQDNELSSGIKGEDKDINNLDTNQFVQRASKLLESSESLLGKVTQ